MALPLSRNPDERLPWSAVAGPDEVAKPEVDRRSAFLLAAAGRPACVFEPSARSIAIGQPELERLSGRCDRLDAEPGRIARIAARSGDGPQELGAQNVDPPVQSRGSWCRA